MSVRSNTYEKAVRYLERIYNLVNQEYFDGELEEITLTIQESVRSFGHVSADNTWFTDKKSMKELNISANYLKRSISEIVTTLVHECSHIWNMQHGIKDTSNGYVYHNKRFKKTAEEIGKIIVERHSTYGWSVSSPSQETLDFCKRHSLEDIQIWRMDKAPDGEPDDGPPVSKTKKPSSTRKYLCPCCGSSFRATKKINVLCMECSEKFIESE